MGRQKTVKRFLVIAGLLGIITAAWASAPRDLDAVGQDSLRAAVDSAFARGQYERVELLTLRAGTALDARPVDTRVAVNLTVGYALIMLGR